MIIRETVLMPSLQYVLKRVKGSMTTDTLDELRKFSGYQEQPVGREVMEGILELLSLYLADSHIAREKFKEVIERPFACSQCVECSQCLQYFLIELYQILFESNEFENMKDSIRSNNHYVMERLPDDLYRHLNAKVAAPEYYWEHCKSLRKVKSFDNQLVVLKGLSSSTPAVLNGAFNTRSFHGGGIYLNWNGYGIVIDPGYHFVENMHRVGLTVLDIDAVIVTHEHIDHTNDIRILDDLSYSLSRYGKKDRINHRISWYLDRVTYGLVKTLQRDGSGFSIKTNNIFEICPGQQIIRHEDAPREKEDVTQISQEEYSKEGIIIHQDEECKIILKTVRTSHEKRMDGTESLDNMYLDHTFATIFEFERCMERRKLFYSSDTMYLDEIGEAVRGSDVVIANISSVYEEDLLRIKPKDTHLGYMGCYKLLRAMEVHPPAYFLISEFWNAKTDIRFDIARFLGEEMKEYNQEVYKNTRIIPTDIGMQLDLRCLEVQCSTCMRHTKDFIIMRPRGEADTVRCVCQQCFY